MLAPIVLTSKNLVHTQRSISSLEKVFVSFTLHTMYNECYITLNITSESKLYEGMGCVKTPLPVPDAVLTTSPI